jgi:predicted transcriptional regulator
MIAAKKMTLTIRPGDDMLERLRRYCAAEELKPSQVARRAIKDYLDQVTGAKLGKRLET